MSRFSVCLFYRNCFWFFFSFAFVLLFCQNSKEIMSQSQNKSVTCQHPQMSYRVLVCFG